MSREREWKKRIENWGFSKEEMEMILAGLKLVSLEYPNHKDKLEYQKLVDHIERFMGDYDG